MSWGWGMVFLEPGPHHSEQRKMLRKGIGPQRIGSHGEKVEKNADKLMLTFNNFRGDPFPHILRCVPVPPTGSTHLFAHPDLVPITLNSVLWGI
jgi:hypothetical protein